MKYNISLSTLFRKLNSLKSRFTAAAATNQKLNYHTGKHTNIQASEISPYTSIGDHCYLFRSVIKDYTYLASNINVMNATIGKFCSIAQGVSISLGKHPSSKFVSTHPAFFSVNKQAGFTFATDNHFAEMGNTTIGNDVWIGTNAIIMDDIIIGDGAIVGAGAIVTKNVAPYAIVAGNPAKIIRYRFDADEISFLLTFQWWEKDINWIKANYHQFHDIKLFIKNNE
jgi:acetyltransferase-like isoleucine patch superfamily enzyme